MSGRKLICSYFMSRTLFDEKETSLMGLNSKTDKMQFDYEKNINFSYRYNHHWTKKVRNIPTTYMSSYVCYCFRSKLPDSLNLLSAFPRTLVQGEKGPTDYDFGKRLKNSF